MKTENQKLIDKLDVVIESVNAAIADLEKVKIAMDKQAGVKKLGRSYLYRVGGGVFNGLALRGINPYTKDIESHLSFICWLDRDWMKIK